MELTERQRYSISELMNIAFARTGPALSELTGRRVLLNAPDVSAHPTTELPKALVKFIPGEVASIHQVFGGPAAGDALLLLNHDGAVHLTDLLTDGNATPSSRLDESAREVLTEVGNILLNACLGMFGNLLDGRVSLSVRGLRLDTHDDVLPPIAEDGTEPQYALIISTAFHIRDSSVTGFLVMVLSVASLD